MQNQANVFITFTLNGLLLGILFDFFRTIRKCFRTSDIITHIEDLLYGVLSGLLIIYSTFKFNEGNIRMFLFLGIIIGITIYRLLFSKVFIKTCIFIINTLKIITHYVIIIPFNYIKSIIKRLVYKPFIFICLNINKLIKKIEIFKIKKIKKQNVDIK